MRSRVRLSAFGLFLAALYVIPSIASVVWATRTSDPQSHYVLLQLPIGIQAAALVRLGLAGKLSGISWTGAYLLLGLPIALLLYGIGAVFGRVIRALLRRAGIENRS